MRLKTSEVRKDFAEVVNRVAYQKERVLLERRGKNVAAIVPMEDFSFLEELEDRIDLEDARAALREVKKKGTVSWKKIKAELGL
jgi:prevent-host-death family protein